MSFLVDTSVWIEWLVNGSLAKKFEPYLISPHDLVIPTIVQLELYKWVRREKDEAAATEVVGYTERGNVIPLDTTLALYAAEIGKQYHLAMADAIVYATSQLHQATLVTCDKHFKALKDVQYYSKEH